jgi:thioredoxin reductase
MAASHLPKVLYNWSQNIVVCTNSKQILNEEQKAFFARYGIGVIEAKIARLVGQAGQLARVVFEGGQEIERTGGLVGIQWKQATAIGQELGCAVNDLGGIATDPQGRTNVKGVYAAGDTSTTIAQAQLIVAAASGNKAGAGVNTDLMESYFAQPIVK